MVVYRLEVVWILVGVEAAQQDPEHEQWIWPQNNIKTCYSYFRGESAKQN